MFKIIYNYNTGDSFHQEHELHGEIETTWENIEIAEENLKRIEEHYSFYEELYNHESKSKKQIIEENKDKIWFVRKYEFCLNLKADDGKEFQYSASKWCGYFESLNWAEIVEEPKPSSKRRIEFK